METFFSKVVESLQKYMNDSAVEVGKDFAKIICECIYCGRSKRSLPHLGIIIEPVEDDKITGGVNCFRCGVSNSLREFLLSISDILKSCGITKQQIQSKVIVKSLKEKIFRIEFAGLMRENFVQQHKFYHMMKTKYSNRIEELKNIIDINMNGFSFIKDKLDLNLNYTIYDAYRILKSVKAKCTRDDNNVIITFDNRVSYICSMIPDTKEIKFDNDLDETLYSDKKFTNSISILNYTKKKIKEVEGRRYYIINDSNYEKDGATDIMNMYICEGIFDTLSIKFYKNRFSLDKINSIRKNILNFYIAVCHSRIDKFVHEYINGFEQTMNSLPIGIKEINIILVPDLNMNVRKYIASMYKYINFNQSKIVSILSKVPLKIYYLDLHNHFSHFKCKDINDIVRTCDRKLLRNIEAVNIF